MFHLLNGLLNWNCYKNLALLVIIKRGVTLKPLQQHGQLRTEEVSQFSLPLFLERDAGKPLGRLLKQILLCFNLFMPTVPTFAVRETSVSDSKCWNGGHEWGGVFLPSCLARLATRCVTTPTIAKVWECFLLSEMCEDTKQHQGMGVFLPSYLAR